MENGIKCEVKTLKVAPFQYQGMTLDREYIGQACCYENGKRLWCHTSGIRRISKGAALKDAQLDAKDLAITKFFNESCDKHS